MANDETRPGRTPTDANGAAAAELRRRLGRDAVVLSRDYGAAYEAARAQFAFSLGSAEEAARRIAPSLIVKPASERDVSEAIRYGSAHGYRIACRSGGHQYSGLSSSGLEDGPSLQLDLSAFAHVRLPEDAERRRRDPDHRGPWTVVLGAGARLEDVYRILAHYRVVLPGGVCNGVGVGGHLQSSGIGPLARGLGSAMDHVTRVRIALPETGEIVDATAAQHADLYHAVLGGSPGAFGAVLEYELELPDTRSFPHSFGAVFTWEYTPELFRRMLETKLRLFATPYYQELRDLSLYLVTMPLYTNPFLASDERRPARMQIQFAPVWSGVDSGSIHGPVPAHLLPEGTPEGATFYSLLVAPFLELAPPIDEASVELEAAHDPDHHLATVIRVLAAPVQVGSLEAAWARTLDALDLPAERRQQCDAEARELARSCGVDPETEMGRYATTGACTTAPAPRAGFVDAAMARMEALAAQPDLWCMFQTVGLGGQIEKNAGLNAFPHRSAKFGYDVWLAWRGSSGADAAARARRWLDETERALRPELGGRVGRLLYCTCGNVDLDDPEVRREYYPSEPLLRWLEAVKARVDPQNRFRSSLTVRPRAPSAPAARPRTLPAVNGAPSLVRLVVERAAAAPDRPYLTWFDGRGRPGPTLRYGELVDRALRIAAWLVEDRGVAPGERVPICMAPGPAFVEALLGCMCAGAVPVPIYPFSPSGDDRFLETALHILADSGARFGLVDRAVAVRMTLARFTRARRGLPRITWRVPRRAARPFQRPVELARGAAALVQYTSGATEAPRGVVLSHDNLLAQLRLNAEALDVDEDSRGFVWVPQYHDFGLISSLLGAMAAGAQLGMMSPRDFVLDPSAWFEGMHRFRATHTAAPNFGYALALERTTAAQRASWDLSSLEVLMSAAEPIDVDLMDRFLDAFAASGLRRQAFCPAYGLAEHTVGVTVFGRSVLSVDPLSIGRERVVLAPEGSGLRLSSCGPVRDDAAVRIVRDGVARGELEPGEIWVTGRCKATAYVDRARVAHTLEARLGDSAAAWLRTGDLGFLHRGELFVIDRLDHLVPLPHGPVAPHWVERCVNAAADWVRPGSTTAYATADGGLGILVETSEAPRGLAEATARLVARLPIAPRRVTVVKRGTLLKTTSGKLRRTASKRALEQGQWASATLHDVRLASSSAPTAGVDVSSAAVEG